MNNHPCSCPTEQCDYESKKCYIQTCIGEGTVRLTWENKTRTNHGLLEIKHSGQWGTICDDSVNITTVSQVACKQLGYETVIMGDIGGTYATARPEKIWLDELNCLGNETKLTECHHHPWGQNNCNG